MSGNRILDLPLTVVLRSEIALPLQQVLHIYTVGNFLAAWRRPAGRQSIEHCFDSPQQALHTAQTFAAWLGLPAAPAPRPVEAWWQADKSAPANLGV